MKKTNWFILGAGLLIIVLVLLSSCASRNSENDLWKAVQLVDQSR